jgi:hypothetical protein
MSTVKTQMPWTDALDEILMHFVILHRAHISSKVSESWNAVNNSVWIQPEFATLKDVHFVPGSYRKIRDHYAKKIQEKIQSNIETGNQSGKEGDMSPLFKKVKRIVEEMDENI